ncbi:hypothetical protein BGZ60DRAFT_525442 [Tricladium varicosporioides]|nr:hypothetical protein BGZ60DRAFT_525442 [Hymenoscyphus varicosporioides]
MAHAWPVGSPSLSVHSSQRVGRDVTVLGNTCLYHAHAARSRPERQTGASLLNQPASASSSKWPSPTNIGDVGRLWLVSANGGAARQITTAAMQAEIDTWMFAGVSGHADLDRHNVTGHLGHAPESAARRLGGEVVSFAASWVTSGDGATMLIPWLPEYVEFTAAPLLCDGERLPSPSCMGAHYPASHS